ncbi:MAG: MBL fold metallo-hydrolase [Gammaproteobacteria bacterium]|nr:MBL fold metallo-hydrolase [Gammaproteobacteria bacterium]MDE2344962.1 MBL fold metallo-hydrolase [Gammaproteobacteria bacterium]
MPESTALHFEHGIHAIDTHYVRPLLDASHLLVRAGRAAFVDTGTSHSVPGLLQALRNQDLDPGDVEYVFLTHVHLDHAGGAGALLKHLPNARVLVHPRGAAHLVNPDKLITGTKQVYGERKFAELYGEIPPIAAQRIVEVQDNARFRLGGGELLCIHTPGHALHHYCIVDGDSHSVFTGDSFGISYRVFDSKNGAFIFPATTPTHFDPQQAHASLERIMDFEPQACFLTHYSRVTDVQRLCTDMHMRLDAFVRIARECAAQGAQRRACMRVKMHAYLLQQVREHGCTLDQQTVDTWLEMDVELNAQGLAVWLDRVQR